MILANYEIEENLLKKYLPAGTEIDTWNGRCYVGLVGLCFWTQKVKGFPFRFIVILRRSTCVLRETRNSKSRIKKRRCVYPEIVPKRAISLIANAVYNEPYVRMEMRHKQELQGDSITIQYGCKNGRWHRWKRKPWTQSLILNQGSEEEFITEHYWGYTRTRKGANREYGVEHPSRKMYPVTEFRCDFDFGALYGCDFEGLSSRPPIRYFT